MAESTPAARKTPQSDVGENDVGATEEVGNKGVDIYVTPRRSPRLRAQQESSKPPVVGMAFGSMEEVEAFYKDYAQSEGFGVTRAQGSYTKDKVRRATTWRCECWGDPDTKEKRKSRAKVMAMEMGGCPLEEDPAPEIRNTKKCFCTAMLYASLDEHGRWVVRKVILDHANHKPSPSKAFLVKEYRMHHFNRSVKRRLMNDIEVGVPIAKIHSSMTLERGGYENMPLTEKDMRHVVDKERNLKMQGGDSNALVLYFDKMQAENASFFHTHRLDWEGKMKDVLWVDARSRAAYEEFSDVVCFDTTYLTNKYTLPFANFVGVNHHGQSVLFGCALITNEDCDTFEWVFRQWLTCMRGQAPGGILTDQAAAMRRPLEEVMPNTRHRWCIWNILQKVPDKLRWHDRYAELKEDLLDAVYNSLSQEEFERAWARVINEYELGENEWLTNLFVERHMWVPAFMKDHFWAGMRTIQRVESINSFFDQFVHRDTMLCEFGERYAAAVEKRAADERTADSRSEKWLRKYATGYHAERFFRKIYTNNKFRDLQKECEKLSYCYVVEEIVKDTNHIEYLMEDRVWILPKKCTEEILTNRRVMYCVVFNPETKGATCDCRMFETHGIMCRHLIRVYDQNRIQPIPEQFVLRRWRKDVSRRHTKIPAAFRDSLKTQQARRLDRLNIAYEPLTDLAIKKEKYTTIVLKGIKAMELEILKAMEEDPPETTNTSKSDSGGGSSVPPNSSVPPLSDSLVVRSSQSPAPPSQCSENARILDLSATPTSRPTTVNIKDPPIPKKKGRPRTTRFKAAHEEGYNKGSTSKAKKCQGESNKGGKRKDKVSQPSQVTTEVPVIDTTSTEPQKLQVKRRRKSVSFADVMPTHDDLPVANLGDDVDVLMSRNSLAFD